MGCMEWGGNVGGGGAYSYPSSRGPAPRTYVSRTSSIDDLVPKSVKTKSTSPVVIACDVTGSMKRWPGIIFEKLPLLYKELKETYLKDPEISFAAVGDAHCDEYPLQVQDFDKGKSLDDKLGALMIEGGGGGQVQESYEIAALYYARNAKIPKATKPVFIFIGDEMMYERVDQQQAEDWARTGTEKNLAARDVMDELKSKYSVYMIRKLYDGGDGDSMSHTDRKIQAQWEDLLGTDKVKILPEPERVVDLILGIVAEDVGMGDDFEKELKARQRPEQVHTVLKSLRTGGKGTDSNPMASRLIKKGAGKKSVRLLED